jgi:superfamily II DNA or RNA helicase
MVRSRNSRLDPSELFGEEQELALQQLRLLEWWRALEDRKKPADEGSLAESRPIVAMPDHWNLTKEIDPHPWQQECILKWSKKGRGTVKVVTGGGKTMLALLIAQMLQNTQDKELRLVVIVPTIVLMLQWYQEIIEHSNLPADAIGRLGGGYDEDFQSGRRILICVLASASQRLAKIVKEANVSEHLLLVADECHRAGADEMSNVFKTRSRWTLGLSATPERDDDDAGYNDSLLGKKLGPIVFEFNLADALSHDLVPKFTIYHLGLSMTMEERHTYDALSRSITDSLSQLKGMRDPASDGDFFSWARSVASRNQGELGGIAMRFVSDTSKRRELLNHLDARYDAVNHLIHQEFQVNPDARVILFHESITDVMDLFGNLWQSGFKVIAEHSELPGSVREDGLELFRQGKARIIVSARSLIEGFNVPAVDVGIIVASSGSVRQRIQSLGRVLRRHRGADGEEKSSRIYVLYAAQSSEEHIYGKIDWNQTTGVESNKFFLWTDLTNKPIPQDGPPQLPAPTELQVDAATLNEGAKYPGQYEGIELTCDTNRNISNVAGQFAEDTAALAEAILKVKGTAGKFRVTPQQRYVLVRVPIDDDWETLFVTRLKKPLRFNQPSQTVATADEVKEWAQGAAVGVAYPFAGLPFVTDDLRFKKKAGGVISKKMRGGEIFARAGHKATDPRKGKDAERLVAAIKDLQKSGRRISRIEINEVGHVLYRDAGRLYFVCALSEGLEFPEFVSN